MISFFKATLLQETVILQMAESRRAERFAPRFTATEVEQAAFKLVRRQQPASGHVQLIVEAFPQPVQRQTAEEQVQSVLIRIEQGARRTAAMRSGKSAPPLEGVVLIWPYKGLLLVRPLKEARPDFRRYSQRPINGSLCSNKLC
ncbi:hypothetical protein AXF13_05805 [Desulfovibrio fairfieldensis]|uniref:Uncharacterized protein n=1 Tax=Desulfovibrio fairfieldensis TaxID=44742 RepID=A0A0X8JJ66_9BACT|nr:hypothetical protein AXF13_05805 [Desulfovibrio fairfieldensis]